MIKLYGRGQSRSFRGLWALQEAAVEFEYIEVDGDLASSEKYAAINPQRKVPTLTHDKLVLTESAAIVNYAAAQAKAPMIPSDAANRARYDNLCYFIMSDYEQPLWTIGKHRFVLPPAQRQESILSTANWEYEKSEQALLDHLGNREYAVGEQFSYADLLISHTISWAVRFDMPVADKLQTYQANHYARAACVASLALLEG